MHFADVYLVILRIWRGALTSRLAVCIHFMSLARKRIPEETRSMPYRFRLAAFRHVRSPDIFNLGAYVAREITSPRLENFIHDIIIIFMQSNLVYFKVFQFVQITSNYIRCTNFVSGYNNTYITVKTNKASTFVVRSTIVVHTILFVGIGILHNINYVRLLCTLR